MAASRGPAVWTRLSVNEATGTPFEQRKRYRVESVPGVERVEEEFRAAFPDARVALASSDTFLGPAQTQAVIRAFAPLPRTPRRRAGHPRD